MFLAYDWCGTPGVQTFIKLIKTAITIIRYAVPIGLVIMTSLDIFHKVLNPDDKDGQKKILNRVVAAVIVFFVPTIVNILFVIIDKGLGNDANSRASISECWGGQ